MTNAPQFWTARTMPRTSRRSPRGGRTPWTATVGGGAALTLAAAALVGGMHAAPAEAATQVGNDISWPQCPAPAGYGNPMPADATGFVVLGLTQGIPFTVNPCLADQARWVRDRSRPFQAYTMAAYPTDQQLSLYGGKGPFKGGTTADALSNAGYAEAADAVSVLRRVGLLPTRLWVDVEKRNGQPWPAGTDKQAGNVAVLQGILAGLKSAGIAAGFYANASDWSTITGSWQSPTVPFWATVGTRGQATALAACATPGLNGGPVHLVQWWTTSPAVDWDAACAGHDVPAPAATLSWPSSTPAWSLASAPGVRVSAGPSRRQSWSLTAKDACTGGVVRTISGTTSDLISLAWDGQTDAGQPAPVGAYRLTLRTGTTAGLSGPSFTAVHEVATYGTARVGGCRVARTAGPDVYATAVETGKVAFPLARTAVLASGESAHIVDALTAAPYARALKSPLLLTASATLPPVVAAELQRRGVRSVVVVGGPGAVSAGVVDALGGLGIAVTRVAGADRYATAALLARRVGGAKREILVASGADGHVGYALAAAGPAAGLGLPVLLTAPGSVPASTRAALRTLGADRATVTVVGPLTAVSSGVQSALRSSARSVRRVSGVDAAGTAAALTSTYAKRLGAGGVVVVNGAASADLLEAGSLGRAILLTTTTAAPTATAKWLKSHPGATVRVIGPPPIVSTAVVLGIGK